MVAGSDTNHAKTVAQDFQIKSYTETFVLNS